MNAVEAYISVYRAVETDRDVLSEGFASLLAALQRAWKEAHEGRDASAALKEAGDIEFAMPTTVSNYTVDLAVALGYQPHPDGSFTRRQEES